MKKQLFNYEKREDDYQKAICTERESALNDVRTNIQKYPESPQEIAAYFVSHYPDRIAFTERGIASLDFCKTAPKILWDVLYQMSTTLFELYTSEKSQAIDKEFSRRSGLKMARGEGSMTRKDHTLMRQYQDNYKGKVINIEAHIKTSENRENNPKFVRVYFYFDSEEKKVIIGSCGKHMDNYTTRKKN